MYIDVHLCTYMYIDTYIYVAILSVAFLLPALNPMVLTVLQRFVTQVLS